MAQVEDIVYNIFRSSVTKYIVHYSIIKFNAFHKSKVTLVININNGYY